MRTGPFGVTPGAGGSEMVRAEAPPLPRAVLQTVKLIGKTAGLATKAADRTAEGMIRAGHKALSLPTRICPFSSRARAKRLAKRQLQRLNTEIARQESLLAGFYTEIGRRLCELDTAVLPDDAQLTVFMSTARDFEKEAEELKTERRRVTGIPAKAEAKAAPPEHARRTENAEIRETASSVTPEKGEDCHEEENWELGEQ